MAVIAKQRYKLDITPQGGWVIIYASQHDDEAREIEFEIINQGKVFSIPASINVSVQGIKSNGGYFSHSCSYSGNIVTMALADDMTDVIGKAICVLKFTNQSNQKLATAKFVLNVDTDASSEGVIIDTEAEEIFNQMLNEIRVQAASVSADIAELQSMVGSPLVASTVSAMTDHNKIYVYTGSESGYTNGNWYYWNGSAWTSGGVYNAVAISIDSVPTQGSNNAVSSGGVYNALDTLQAQIPQIDSTLTQAGQAADAKETGDGLTGLKTDLNVIENDLNTTWEQGFYRSDGIINPNNQYNNIYSALIETTNFRKIVVHPGDDRQVCIAYFDKSTRSFVSRTEWSETAVVIDDIYNVALNVATIAQDRSKTIEEMLSQVDIYAIENKWDSVFKSTHIVVQGWDKATAKPQTYYASYYGIQLMEGDTVTAKAGYDVALTYPGGTLHSWASSFTVTASDIVVSSHNLIIRRTGANEELIIAENGIELSTYIEEDYDSSLASQNANEIYGSTFLLLNNAIDKHSSGSISKWTGKKVAFIGDSITFGVNTSKRYYEVLNDEIGFAEVYADGIAGSSYSVTANDNYTPISERWQNIPVDRDLVVIFAGTNDWGHNTPLGTIADTTDISFYGAISVVINGILEANPDVRLALLTPLHRWGYTGGAYPNDTQQNGQNHTLKDYVDAIKEIAEMYGVPIIDLFSTASLNPRISAIKTIYVTDGLHPNTAGHKILASRIAPLLETL